MLLSSFYGVGILQRHAYIDALRGYAILGVVMVHASQSFPGLHWAYKAFTNQGQRGVQLFFVASAFTLALSWHARNDGPIPFFIRRFFRIAPMFWLAIVFFVALNGLAPSHSAPNGIGWPHILATAAFLHGWHPETINSVVPGGWSIAVEVTFYLLFPFAIFLLRSWRSTVLAVVFSFVIARLLNPLPASWWPDEERYLVETFAYLWFPNQLLAFLVGILVFHLSRELNGKIPRLFLEAGVLLCVALVLQAPFGLRFKGFYELLFGGITLCLALGAGGWLATRPVRWLGTISYSGYLWHFAILGTLSALGLSSELVSNPVPPGPSFLIFFATLLAMTAAMSALTYRHVETRGIELGRTLADKFAQAHARATKVKEVDVG